MKKILYYVGIALAAGCLVCYFVPAFHSYSIFGIMIDAFSYSNGVANGVLIAVMLVFSVLALVFVAVKKQVPAIIFAALGLGLVCTLNIEVVKVVFIILSALLIASQIYALILDKKEPNQQDEQPKE